MQALLAQHGLPVTPHGLHTLAVVSQASVASPHLAPLVQQGSPAPPHFKHWYDVETYEQIVDGSLQVPPVLVVVVVGQHGWPGPPQAQDPLLQVP
jgi:hypothetical protein